MSVNGTTITYVDEGTGPMVLFVHGAYSDHRVWEAQREVVTKGYRYVVLDLRYFGTAPWSDDGKHFNVATHAADVAAFIRALKVGPIHLVGRSYGAITSLAVAIGYPELVRSLFLNEPWIPSAVTNAEEQKLLTEDRRFIGPVAAAAKTGNNAEAVKLFFEGTHNQPGAFDSLPPARRAMLLDNARTVALQVNPAAAPRITCAQLGEIKVPVEITIGDQTRTFYRITVGAVHRCIPSSRLITIRGATHGAPSQQPAAFNEALLAFLARTSVRSVRVNDYDMAYVELGTGEPIVLLHGGLNDYRQFSDVMALLSAKYRVIAPSRRHHYPERWDGKSGTASTRQHVADLVAFLRKVDAGPVHLMGHSRGAGVALYVASTHPQLVRTLTVLEGGGLLVPGDQERSRQRSLKMMAMYELGRMDEALAELFDSIYGPGAWSKASEARRQGFGDNAWTIKGVEEADPYTCADAGRINIPILLVGGENSSANFGKGLDALQACVKRSERVTIRSAGHYMPRDNPFGLSQAVLDFISKH